MEKRETSRKKARLLASLFIVAGLSLIAFLGQTTTLICQWTKSGIHCRIEKDFLGFILKQVTIHQLQKAEVEYQGPTGPNGGSNPTYRVVLITENGNRFPMTSAYTGGRDEKQEAADRINAFIANPSDQPPPEIRMTGWLGWFWGGVMLMVGVGIIMKSVRGEEEKRQAEERKKLGISGGVENELEEEAEL